MIEIIYTINLPSHLLPHLLKDAETGLHLPHKEAEVDGVQGNVGGPRGVVPPLHGRGQRGRQCPDGGHARPGVKVRPREQLARAHEGVHRPLHGDAHAHGQDGRAHVGVLVAEVARQQVLALLGQLRDPGVHLTHGSGLQDGQVAGQGGVLLAPGQGGLGGAELAGDREGDGPGGKGGGAGLHLLDVLCDGPNRSPVQPCVPSIESGQEKATHDNGVHQSRQLFLPYAVLAPLRGGLLYVQKERHGGNNGGAAEL
mmetsp:Transcript_34616/g.54578  ORF Transcript_34616/g.54578 Transcript_34616/m.54578 type:complete len:255 (-) Transcript_34616:240-1004(-)